MMPSNRRQFVVGSLSLAIGLASTGCIGDIPSTSSDEPTGSQTDSPKGSPSKTETPPPKSAERSVGGDTVAVTDIVAEKAVGYDSLMGAGGVAAPEGRQFVVASVHSKAKLKLASFTLQAGGETWSAVTVGDEGSRNYAVANHEGGVVGGPAAAGSDTKRYLTFELDSPIEADDAQVVLERGGESAEWTLNSAARETLVATSPSFELDSLSIPDSIQQGQGLPVELTATNTSDTDGRFLAAVYWPTKLIADDDESHRIEEIIDAGASTTIELSIDTEYTTTEDGPITLRVDGHVSAEQEVSVEGASTPT